MQHSNRHSHKTFQKGHPHRHKYSFLKELLAAQGSSQTAGTHLIYVALTLWHQNPLLLSPRLSYSSFTLKGQNEGYGFKRKKRLQKRQKTCLTQLIICYFYSKDSSITRKSIRKQKQIKKRQAICQKTIGQCKNPTWNMDLKILQLELKVKTTVGILSESRKC